MFLAIVMKLSVIVHLADITSVLVLNIQCNSLHLNELYSYIVANKCSI